MAAIDYGVLVFKNGEQIHWAELFPTVKIGPFQFMFYKIGCLVKFANMDFNVIQFEGAKATYFSKDRGHVRPFYTDNYERVSSRTRMISGEPDLHIKQIADMVYRFRMSLEGDHYTVIYGSGIDINPEIWRRVKHRYHNKKDVRRIDREIERAGGYR